jgi:hypothetical protein
MSIKESLAKLCSMARRASGYSRNLRLNSHTSSYASSLGERLYSGALARVLLYEIRRSYHGILLTLQTRIDRRGLTVDPIPHVESQIRRQAQHACTEDMRRLCADRPWITLLDAELFFRGWKQGAEWFLRNGYSTLPELEPSPYETCPEHFKPLKNRVCGQTGEFMGKTEFVCKAIMCV